MLQGALTLRWKENRSINVDKLRQYMNEKQLEVIDTLQVCAFFAVSVSTPHSQSLTQTHLETTLAHVLQDINTKIRKASWQETDSFKWEGEAPKIEIQYDALHQFMLNVVIRLNARNTPLTDQQIRDRFVEIMEEKEVMLRNEHGEKQRQTKEIHDDHHDENADIKPVSPVPKRV